MTAFAIILAWCFVVACACILGTNKELKELGLVINTYQKKLHDAQEVNRLAHDKAAMLLRYVETDREYKTFDRVLSELPIGNYRGHPRQHQILEAKRFDYAAHLALSEPCPDSMTVTALSFNAVPLHFYGKEYTGWERNGWVIMPKDALIRS